MIDPAKGSTWLHNSRMSVLLLLLLVAIVFVIPVVVPGPTLHLVGDVLMSLILVSGVVAVAYQVTDSVSPGSFAGRA